MMVIAGIPILRLARRQPTAPLACGVLDAASSVVSAALPVREGTAAPPAGTNIRTSLAGFRRTLASSELASLIASGKFERRSGTVQVAICRPDRRSITAICRAFGTFTNKRLVFGSNNES